jgi:hypothetical protein
LMNTPRSPLDPSCFQGSSGSFWSHAPKYMWLQISRPGTKCRQNRWTHRSLFSCSGHSYSSQSSYVYWRKIKMQRFVCLLLLFEVLQEKFSAGSLATSSMH